MKQMKHVLALTLYVVTASLNSQQHSQLMQLSQLIANGN